MDVDRRTSPLCSVATWPELADVIEGLRAAVVEDGRPDVLVGVLRGGMIPAVLLAHGLGVRDVRAVEVTHTLVDGPDAAKTAAPTARNVDSLGNLAGRDVLVVDDVAGSGATLRATHGLVAARQPSRLRTAVCALNERNWHRCLSSCQVRPTYVGVVYREWVIFPWESR